MLINLLQNSEKILLLNLAELLALSDNDLLWDGKKIEDIKSNDNLDELTIQENKLESELLDEMARSAQLTYKQFNSKTSIELQLVDELKKIPIALINKPENRLKAPLAVINKIFKTLEKSNLSSAKTILFELFLIALRNGKISSINWSLLKEVQKHYQLEDFIFDDLLKCAEALNTELSKTIAIILE